MPYLKTFVNVSIDFPVYVDVPDGLDYYDIQEIIEDTRVSWTFADDDVVDAVKNALPAAENITTDVGASDDIFDACPNGSLVYKLSRISTPKAIRRYIAERTAERFKDELEAALANDDYEEVRRISEELCKLQLTRGEEIKSNLCEAIDVL